MTRYQEAREKKRPNGETGHEKQGIGTKWKLVPAQLRLTTHTRRIGVFQLIRGNAALPNYQKQKKVYEKKFAKGRVTNLKGKRGGKNRRDCRAAVQKVQRSMLSGERTMVRGGE